MVYEAIHCLFYFRHGALHRQRLINDKNHVHRFPRDARFPGNRERNLPFSAPDRAGYRLLERDIASSFTEAGIVGYAKNKAQNNKKHSTFRNGPHDLSSSSACPIELGATNNFHAWGYF